MSRLTAEEREEWEVSLKALGDPDAGDSGRLIRRITELSARADQFDPLEELPEPEPLPFQSAVFRSVWAEAAAMRRAGVLLEAASRLRCPVLAIHGDHDPHPAEGVRDSLARVRPGLRFILLRQCGHQPWSERHARDPFYDALRAELGGHAPPDPGHGGAG